MKEIWEMIQDIWKTFLRSPLYIRKIRPVVNVMKVVIWYSLLLYIGWITFDFQKQNPIGGDAINIALPNIISTIGIMNAILITFIFAKLYAEKSEIVSRKKRIVQLSNKINALRKIAYILFKRNQFLNNPELIEEYQNYIKLVLEKKPYIAKYEDFSTIKKEVPYNGNQHVFDLESLWWLDNCFINRKDKGKGSYYRISKIDDDYIRYNNYNQLTYKTEDLDDLYDKFYWLFEYEDGDFRKDFMEIENFSDEDKSIIADNIKIITEKEATKIVDNKTLYQTISDYLNIFLNEHYILLKLNSGAARSYFNNLLFDLLVFVVLIITGLLMLNSNTKISTVLLVNQLIIAFFVATVVDILKNIILAVRFEFKAHGVREK